MLVAKQKGGLGRGLDSLLGSAPSETAQEDPRVKATESAKPSAGDRPLPVKQGTGQDGSLDDEMTITEDHTTIKSVTQREVSPEKKAATKSATAQSAEDAGKTTDELSIDSIEPNPDQPRISFKKEDMDELSESIKRSGLLQPIVVRRLGDKYQIVAGERRWQASRIAGLTTVPVRIIEANDDEALMLALVENVQRADLNPIEEAYGYRRMMERGKMTQTQVAQAVSKGRSTVANALRLLELPEDAQEMLFDEVITPGHARAILSISDKEGRAKLTAKLKKEKLSVRETESIARLWSGKAETKKEPRPQMPKSYKTVARSLRDALQTDVHVKSSQGKNKIEIMFKDEADLERLYRIMLGE